MFGIEWRPRFLRSELGPTPKVLALRQQPPSSASLIPTQAYPGSFFKSLNKFCQDLLRSFQCELIPSLTFQFVRFRHCYPNGCGITSNNSIRTTE
jgi:hypothetical protein